MTRLILFDVDGTLITTGGAGRRAMRRAFADVCEVTVPDGVLDTPGRTDRRVVADVIAAIGAAPLGAELYERWISGYERFLRDELQVAAPGSVRILPGVTTLLQRLRASADTVVALLTGNFQRTAAIKLGHLGLWDAFAWGAFGDAALDRSELVQRAVEEFTTRVGAPPRRIAVIGDTPLDVQCARDAGAVAVAVATGIYAPQQLCAAGADHVFVDLRDTTAVLDALSQPSE